MTDKVAAEGLIASPASQKGNMTAIPRRIKLDSLCPAERAIYDAVQAVEAMAADVRLTDAVVLLQAARESVADYMDNIWPSRRYVSRAEVSSPARPPLAKIALADDIIEQVQRHYAGSGPLPTKGSTTVYADAQMVLAALAEGAVSAAPLGGERQEKKDV